MDLAKLQLEINKTISDHQMDGEFRQVSHGLMAIAREFGQLCNVHIERESGGNAWEKYEAEELAIIGTIAIYLLDHCQCRGICFETAVESAWYDIKTHLTDEGEDDASTPSDP